jgi:hypothetical protein
VIVLHISLSVVTVFSINPSFLINFCFPFPWVEIFTVLVSVPGDSMRPVRKSSEGPEVVLNGEGPEADKYFVPYRERIQKATGSQYQKQLDDRIPTPEFPPPPLTFEPPPHIPEPYLRRRTCGLVTTFLIAVIAFLIGGGIGGGVGGALVANEQAKISR